MGRMVWGRRPGLCGAGFVNESRHDQHEREVREAQLMQAVGLLAWLIFAGMVFALIATVAVFEASG